MKLDKIDLKLLNELYTVESKKTTTSLAKKIFDTPERHDVQKLDSKTRDRLKKLTRYKLVVNEKENGKRYYSINRDAIVCAKGTIKTKPKSERLPEKEMKTDNMVLITTPQGMYIHAFIPVEED